jgi:mono/diheme cytochrome c family protein
MITGRDVLGLTLGLLLTGGCAGAQAPATKAMPERTTSTPGFYSAQQAARGADAFTRVCGECHAISEFRGQDFEWRWRRRSAWNLYRTMAETMPEDNPGGLPAQTYTDVVAYILQLNEYAAGTSDLAGTEAALDAIPLGPGALKTPTIPTSNDR